MYLRYAEKNALEKTELVETARLKIGGVKREIMLVKGKGTYSRLKYEGILSLKLD